MIREYFRKGIPIAFLIITAASITACNNDTQLLAKVIESGDELIGGPSAKGKIGDYLLENDKIRVIIAGSGASYAAGLFGGGVLDVDLQRWRSEDRQNNGWDSFSESFPLANLLTPNPNGIMSELGLDPKDGSIKLINSKGALSIINDGTDGTAAVLRMTGHSDYMFDMLKFLNRELIDSLLQKISFGGMEFTPGGLADLVGGLVPGVNLFGLLNRLQLGIDFSTDYILEPGKPWLKLVTSIKLSPPYAGLLAGCPALSSCNLTATGENPDCPNGYAMKELSESLSDSGTAYKRMCPICVCASETKNMPTFNEPRDFFSLLLGTPTNWADPTWKGGVVAGDFLFFGSEAPAFIPGPGYDIDRKVYENMYDGVGTMGSPITVDWVAATGRNVSYAWATTNPNELSDFECPYYRLAISRVEDDDRDFVAGILQENEDFDLAYKIGPKDAAARVKTAVVDNKAIYLVKVTTPAASTWEDLSAEDRLAAFSEWKDGVLADQGASLSQKFDNNVKIDLIAAHECMPSKLMIPLFSSSATAVLTHFTEGDGLTDDIDTNRSYTFTRYLTVGEGDVAAAIRPVYELRKTPYGELSGLTFERKTGRPLSKMNVFVLEYLVNPDTGKEPVTFQEYRILAQKQIRSSGFVTQMESDTGIDFSLDGSFGGPVKTGTFFVFAHDGKIGNSDLVKVEIRQGETAVVNLSVAQPASIEYRISDNSGLLIPGRITFMPVELDSGVLLDPWTASNEPELGDSRYDHSIGVTEHSLKGEGAVTVPAGKYNIYVSHGIEYGIKKIENYEVHAAEKKSLSIQLNREMDTTGYVAGDLHLHTIASTDSSLDMDMRLKSILTEDVQFVTANDHDVVIDYQSWINELGLEGYLLSVPSEETSPLEWGHFNLWPAKFDATKVPLHDPVPWQSAQSMEEIWQGMFDRADGPIDAVVLQLNHPRDGVMGYFNQVGMKAYSLERKTGGTMICSKAVEDAPCNFDVLEIFNSKTLHYLYTPTVGEMERFNKCFKEIVAATSKEQFSFTDNGVNATCGWLQADPEAGCSGLIGKDVPAGLDETETNEWYSRQDHCVWHAEMREALAYCDKADTTRTNCKRTAMEAAKLIQGRYMLERTMLEQELSFATYAPAEGDENTACNENGCPDIGCSLQDACEACLKPIAADCYEDGGWTGLCMTMCRDNCPGDDARPCDSSQQPINDWFALMDAGMNVAVSGNSDSHKTSAEVGYPRNMIKSSTDRPEALDRDELNRNIKAGRMVVTSGPMIDFEILDENTNVRGQLGDTITSTDGKLFARIRVQTPSWFKIDTVEIYSNSMLIKQIRVNSKPEDIVDFDDVIELERPAVDAWYVVMTKGLGQESFMTPVYKRSPYGNILISTIIALGAQAILANFDSVLAVVEPLLGSVDDLLSSTEWPDSIPLVPFATTNAIRVDVDGDGFKGARAVDKDADGEWDPPPFCSKPCSATEQCGLNQVCAPRRTGEGQEPGEKICKIPANKTCAP
jgi:hypothetical protein